MTTTVELLKNLKSRGKAAFIPYITAGDPSLEATRRFARVLAEAGASVLELGVPFSDPMADGPVNRRSCERALKRGARLNAVLRLVKRIRLDGITVPIILFTYYNPLLKMGLSKFAAAAKSAGVTGVLALDLPPEEAGEYRGALGAAGLETVFLAAPTSGRSRLEVIGKASTGFVYYVSRTGVTGVRSRLSSTLAEELRRVKRSVSAPVAVGFGISTPGQARTVARLADGVVVGSALVSIIEENRNPAKAEKKLGAFARRIAAAVAG